MTRTALCLLTAALLAACEAPPVFPGADMRQNTTSGRIEGQVVVASQARGRVVLFLYDGTRPPPPQGFGRPLAFTVVPREALFASAVPGSSGPFVAPFAFSLVPPGRYLLRGFVDTNDDFIPWYSVTADVNQGDVGGAAVDAQTHAPVVVRVGETADGTPVPATGVSVSFADTSTVPVDRPVFGAGQGPAPLGAGLALTLAVKPIEQPFVHEMQPVFLVQLVDANGDGVPDDANGDNVPDMWPRVVVRKLADDVPSNLVDENDLDKNGVVDNDGDPVVVLAAGFDVMQIYSQLVDGMGNVKPTPTPMISLPLVVQPKAFDAVNPLAPRPLASVPAGRYAITVIQSTGQTWRVPNELSPAIADGVGFSPVPGQDFIITAP